MTARQSLVRWLRRSRLGARLVAAPALLGPNGYAGQSGWFRSTTEQSAVDRAGEPIPWLSYAAIDFLAGRVRPEWRVFEYGSGHSTLWWASRVARVVAVEHYEPWFERMSERLPGNVRLEFCLHSPPGPYAASAVRSGDRYQIVVIDGRERVACVEPAMDALTTDGVVIFDNTDRERYRPGLEMLAAAGFRRIDFRSLAPVLAVTNQTTVLYRDSNCLGI